MKFNVSELKWTREAANYTIAEDKIEIITKPHTDLSKINKNTPTSTSGR